MTNKMPKPAFKIFLGALAFSFAVASCNGSGDKTETKDSTVITTPPIDTLKPPPPEPIDTAKMDSATTRPVKTPDKTATQE